MSFIWSFILNHKTESAIVAAVLAISFGIWTWGNGRYDSGRMDERQDWQTKIATEPVKTTVRIETLYVPQPVQHLKGKSHPDTPPEKTTDPCEQFKEPQVVSLQDSFGGRHDIAYYPQDQQFTEDYSPPFKTVERQVVTERQEIPLLVERNWWLMLTPSYTKGSVGVGGFLGYKSIGVGYLKILDADIYQVGIHLTF